MRIQARALAAFVHVLRIFDRPRIHFAVFIPVEMRAVNLRPAFEIANAIHQECELSQRRFTSGDRFFDGRQATALERRVPDGVLNDSPSGMGSVAPNERVPGPAMRSDDFFESCRISFVHLTHARIVAIAENAFLEEFGPDADILRFHCEEFFAEGGVHRKESGLREPRFS